MKRFISIILGVFVGIMAMGEGANQFEASTIMLLMYFFIKDLLG